MPGFAATSSGPTTARSRWRSSCKAGPARGLGAGTAGGGARARDGDGRRRRAGSGRGRQEALRFPAAPSIPGAGFGHPRHSGCEFRRVQVSSGADFGHPGCTGAGPRPGAARGCGFWPSAAFRVRIVAIPGSHLGIAGAGSVHRAHPGCGFRPIPSDPGFALKPFANTGFGSVRSSASRVRLSSIPRIPGSHRGHSRTQGSGSVHRGAKNGAGWTKAEPYVTRWTKPDPVWAGGLNTNPLLPDGRKPNPLWPNELSPNPLRPGGPDANSHYSLGRP